MVFRYDEYMSGVERADIKKGHIRIVFVYRVARDVAGSDFTEDAVYHKDSIQDASEKSEVRLRILKPTHSRSSGTNPAPAIFPYVFA